VRAVYGILTADARFLYVTYDSPAQSYLFDLTKDPNAEHNVVNPQLKQHYDEEIIGRLHLIADYYGYKPGVGSLLAARDDDIIEDRSRLPPYGCFPAGAPRSSCS